ncbi:MAG: T9SS type A sorting domain-containing protein [Bacteroidetes bacterium]|nr:T9SS type A sorting domain-containing protein [Bacteroidota bacterium]
MSLNLKGQNPASSCTLATTLPNATLSSVSFTGGNFAWYKFTASSSNASITIVNSNANQATEFLNAALYEGSCGNLSLITSDTLTGASDSTLQLNTMSLTSGNTYYVKMYRKSQGSDFVSKFNVINSVLTPKCPPITFCTNYDPINGNCYPGISYHCSNGNNDPNSVCSVTLCCSNLFAITNYSVATVVPSNPCNTCSLVSPFVATQTTAGTGINYLPISFSNYPSGTTFTIFPGATSLQDAYTCGVLYVTIICQVPGIFSNPQNTVCVGCVACSTFTSSLNAPPTLTSIGYPYFNVSPTPTLPLGNTTTSLIVHSASLPWAYDVSNPFYGSLAGSFYTSSYNYTLANNGMGVNVCNTFTAPGIYNNYFFTSYNDLDYFSFSNNTAGASNCVNIYTMTTLVLTPVETITVNVPANICANSPVVLTATANTTASFTWQPGNLTGATVTLTPSASSTYTVYASNACSNSSLVVQVPVINCCTNPSHMNRTLSNVTIVPYGTAGAAPWGSLLVGSTNTGTFAAPSNSLITGNYSFIGNITLNANLTFSASNVYMSDAAAVMQNQPLVIVNSYWHSCKMWVGISSKNLLSIQNSIIEDAQWAVSTSGITSHRGMIVRNSIFNNNLNSIASGFTTFTNTIFGQPAYNVEGSIFTSRILPASAYASVFSTTTPTFVSSVAPLLSTFSNGVLKGSSILGITYGTAADKGISFFLMPLTQTLMVGAAYANNTLNAHAKNYFERLNYGVYGIGNSMYVINANFNNMFTAGGTGIYSGNSFCAVGNASAGILINSKYAVDFYNCRYGLMALAGGTVIAKYNNFVNCTRAINTNTMSTPLSYAKLSNNTFTNCLIDYYSFANGRNFVSEFSQNTATYSATYDQRYHIYINELSIKNSPFYSITSNTLSGKNIGVFMQVVNASKITDNLINQRYVALTPSLNYDGITLNSVINTTVTGNIIYSQNSGVATNTAVTGINTSIGSNNSYGCNSIANVGACLKFNGGCANSSILNNQLNLNTNSGYSGAVQYGIWTSNYGYTGDIGFPYGSGLWGASGNMFGAFNYGGAGADLFTDNNSNPLSNSLYYIGFPSALNNQYPQQSANSSGNSYARTQTWMPSFYFCGYSYPVAFFGNSNFIPFFGSTLNFGNNTATSLFNARYHIYNSLKNNTALSAATLGASNFLSSNLSSNLGVFYAVDSLAATNSSIAVLNAQSINAGVNTTVTAEQNQKTYNAIYYSYALSHTLTSANKSTLQNLAQLCPFTDGLSVYQARALLSYFDSTEYRNPCEYTAGSGSGSRLSNFAKTTSGFVLETKVYPNPANNEVVIASELEDCTFYLYDLLGRSVIIEKITDEIKVDVSALNPGTYLYKIINTNGEIIKADKLIINH